MWRQSWYGADGAWLRFPFFVLNIHKCRVAAL
jgi:hypothetical protein